MDFIKPAALDLQTPIYHHSITWCVHASLKDDVNEEGSDLQGVAWEQGSAGRLQRTARQAAERSQHAERIELESPAWAVPAAEDNLICWHDLSITKVPRRTHDVAA